MANDAVLNAFIPSLSLDVIPIGETLISDAITATRNLHTWTFTTISGNVTIGRDTPARKRVRLHDNATGELISQMWSDPITGYYEFEVETGKDTFVLGTDDDDVYDDVAHNTADQTNIAFSVQNPFDPDDFSGSGTIYGNVTDPGSSALERRVVLVEHLTFILVDTTVSNPSTGYYEFTGLNTSKIFSVIAEDDTPYSYNDVIKAKVQAEV